MTDYISQFLESLPEIIESVDYDELWGHQLRANGDYYDEQIAKVLLNKFLKANANDLTKAQEQLKNTLEWRKEFRPLYAAFAEEHDQKFDNVVVLTHEDGKEVATWNLYNSDGTSNPKDLFTDLDAFLRFRSGVMERSIQLLDFTKDEDVSSYITQIHDYKGVSFLRFDPDIKKGSRATIKLFQDHYPELLKLKFFVNVPYLMTWVYDFVKRWLNKETTKKFVMLSQSKDLTKYLGSGIPVEYGGKGSSLSEQSLNEVPQTRYTQFLLQEEFTNEVD